MLQWPANSWVFWFVATLSSALLWHLSSINPSQSPSKTGAPDHSPCRLLRRRFVIAWIAAELAAAWTPTAVNLLLGDGYGLRSVSAKDQALFSAGAAIVAFGLVLAAVALFADRSRGRRRCPRCWYDMIAVRGARCPECGKEARQERAFFRTRRRWKGVAGSSILVAAGIGLAAVPIVTSSRWPGFLPLPLLAILDWPTSGIVEDEISGRVFQRHGNRPLARLTIGERLLLARCRHMVHSSALQGRVGAALRMAERFGAHADDLTDSAVRLLGGPDNPVQEVAAAFLGSTSAHDAAIGEHLLKVFERPSDRLHRAAMRALGRRLCLDPSANMDSLIAAIGHPKNSRRDWGWFNLERYPQDPRAAAWARRSLTDPLMGPFAAATLLATEPTNQSAKEVLMRGLRAGKVRALDALIWSVAEHNCDDFEFVRAATDAMTRVGAGYFHPDVWVWRSESISDSCRASFAAEAVHNPILRPTVLADLRFPTEVREAVLRELRLLLPTLDMQTEDGQRTRGALLQLQEEADAEAASNSKR